MRIRRWQWVVLTVVVTIFAAGHLLLGTAAAPSGEYRIDVEALHRAATASGPLPQRIEVEKIGDFAFPETLVVAGERLFHLHPMVLLAHRVVWPDRSIVIDTGMGPEAAKKMPGSRMDDGAFERVQAAISKASDILFTHEHSDHVGGIAVAPNFAALAKTVRITDEQLASPQLQRGDFPAGSLDALHPIHYEGLYAVAPGVVLQKAPGHTVGTQLIYVELASGARFLFVGDIAWSLDNVAKQKGRPALATLLMKEDRPAVAAELRAIGQLPPEVHVIAAHDPVALDHDLSAGLYHMGFGL